MALFVRLNLDTGEVAPMAAEDWQAGVRGPQLTDRVPRDVRMLFDEARESMLHGPCSYALFTRGLEHALKAAEAAVTARAQTAGVLMVRPDGRPTGFAFRLAKLKKLKILSRAELEAWTWIRKFRNLTAHPDQPFLLTPAVAISILGTIAASIEQLFSS
jgi:hypothetical protein